MYPTLLRYFREAVLGTLPIHQILFEGLQLKDFVECMVSYFDEEIWNKVPTSESAPHRRPLHMLATYTNAEAIDQALTFVNTLGASTTCGNDEHIVARYCMAL
jgi:hypothetical protein